MSPDYANGVLLDLAVGKVQRIEEDSSFFAYAHRSSSGMSSFRIVICTADGVELYPIFEHNLQSNGFVTSWSELIKKGTYIKIAENTQAGNYAKRYPATGGITKV